MMDSSKFYATGDPESTKQILGDISAITDFFALQRVCLQFAKQKKGELIGLKLAIQQFERHVQQTINPRFNFFVELLPLIVKYALDFEMRQELGILHQNQESEVRLCGRQIRFLLANSFFMNSQLHAPIISHCGELSWHRLYFDSDELAVERIVCLLAYFFQVGQAHETEVVVYRKVFGDHQKPDWNSFKQEVDVSTVILQATPMESSDAPALVDFANKQLHIGRIIPSLTQEEVLFSICPELFPLLLFVERMKSNEAVYVSGVRRFCTYEGYMGSFQFKDVCTPPYRSIDVVAIDAVMSLQWTRKAINRDLLKAYAGFFSCASWCKGPKKVASGNWGCGIFGGDKYFKFLQQLMAAQIAGVRLDFCTFRDSECYDKLSDLLSLLEQKKPTVGELYNLLVRYNDCVPLS